MHIEQYDLRVLIRHYWRKGRTILKVAVHEISEGAGTATNFVLPENPESGTTMTESRGL